ncbi:glycosyltransferase family 2 protein [candidate division NPL-UPA2 bacterium]|nr:glycosyltransferase family 2 protein [candidate division NPL-UPA2 bacterium]
MKERGSFPQKKISLVIPIFNEEESLSELYREMVTALDGLGLTYELIFVDDGSQDGSRRLLEKLHREDERVKVLELRRNYGKAAALATGFREAEGEIVITLDGDLQDDPGEIANFLKKIDEGYDLVSGWKWERKDSLSKTIPSRLFNIATSLLTGIRIHDFNCGFKAYRKEVTEDIKIYGELHRYLPILAHREGFRIGELKVKHRRRKYGKTKYGLERFPHGFFDLLTILFLTRFMKRPLHLFGMMGALLTLGGFGINLYLAVIRFRFGSILGRYPLLLLGILLMVLGIQFISIGFLGRCDSQAIRGEEGLSSPEAIGVKREKGPPFIYPSGLSLSGSKGELAEI